MSSVRESIESASAPVLQRLAALPKLVPFLVVLALVVGGFLIDGWGWVLLLVVAALLTWFLYVAWPTLSGPGRTLRLAVIAITLAIMLTQAFPRGGSI